MSAILSADDLNDFISPGVACIKPIETLPAQQPGDGSNPYEVTTEDKVAASNPPPAQISLTDCLACSGCVTSAEAVLVSLQSHTEVLNTLDAYPSLPLPWSEHRATNGYRNGIHNGLNGHSNGQGWNERDGKIFVASISPQSRASLAALYNISSGSAGHLIEQLLRGPSGLASGGQHGSHFAYVLDTNVCRDIALVIAAQEVEGTAKEPKKPILTSACPGWICYAEKTHPHILPHLSRLKSPQALTGTLVKSLLWKKYGIPPEKVWHLAVMPCFDKKLEASRAELTSAAWSGSGEPVRDVDCVITVRELLNMADARGISLPNLPLRSVPREKFPDMEIDRFLFPPGRRKRGVNGEDQAAGTSGGYLWHVLQSASAKECGSRVEVERGRNADVVEYRVVRDGVTGKEILFRAARYYGFRNIQNLVRRLKPSKTSRLPGAARRPGSHTSPAQTGSGDYAYVEVMACPGGCTNGGGQIKAADLGSLGAVEGGTLDIDMDGKGGVTDQRKLLAKVDEAYFSASSESEGEDSDENMDEFTDTDAMDIDDTPRVNGHGQRKFDGGHGKEVVNGISIRYISDVLRHWSDTTGIDIDTLVYTSYRAVESDVGKSKGKKTSDVERVAGLASSIGGGW
ncbi:iron-sulfur cluster assembly associated protein-like protein Nar1 [Rhizodiscina lignyota]|uniref:Nuclear architecture-related protein 1 n=1 Tax=Rhizodiscina lignyota TaxID=1504668 RepID=A0A9P4M2G4_9PEZI|nr:iron-sulfur cluster assembly associated protein-like protein Nar1 [Rhizodiscina lignyota]